MKKVFLSILLVFLIIPAFSLTFELSNLGLIEFGGATQYTAGVLLTDNSIFNISMGLLYDMHDIEVKTNTGKYYNDGYERYYLEDRKRENKTDFLIGPYLKLDWAFMPIKIHQDFKLGINFAIQIATTYSKLADFEIPTIAIIGTQARLKKLDFIFGFEYVIYWLSPFLVSNYSDGAGNGGFNIAIRYNLNRRTLTSPSKKQNHTHIINGANLKPIR